MIKPHYEVACAVIEKDNKILCCRRGPKGETAYKWEFPGGKLEPGETKEEALYREIKEELNTSIKINKFLITVNHEYNTFKVTLHVYLCELASDSYELIVHSECMWQDKDKLDELDFAAADYQFLDLLK